MKSKEKINKYGIISTAKEIDTKYKTDFKFLSNIGYRYLDFQGFISFDSELYKMSDVIFKEYLRQLKKEANKYQMSYSQVHALWSMDLNYEEKRDDALFRYKRDIEGTYLLGAPFLVIHPISPLGWNEPFDTLKIKEETMKVINELLPLCKKYNVRIAIENLPFNDNFFSPIETYNFIKEINSEYVVMCLDTGHFNIFHNLDVYKTMMLIGNKVKVLHIHDNDSTRDLHLSPFKGNFDWKAFAKGLKDTKFDGVLSLETCISSSLIKDEKYEDLNKELFEKLKYIDSLAQ